MPTVDEWYAQREREEAARRIAEQMADARGGYRPPYADTPARTDADLAAMIGRIAQGAGNMASDIFGRVQRALGDPRPPSQVEDAELAGRMALPLEIMLPAGVARTVATRAADELGATASRIMQRTDARKMVREMTAQGKSARETAEALNERFAPLLDEGAAVTDDMVLRVRKQEGSITFGALGGGGRAPKPRLEFTADDLASWAREARLKVERWGRPGETQYLRVSDPANPNVSPLTVRVPADGHYGRPRPYTSEIGNFIDTGSRRKGARGGRARGDPDTLQNEAGEKFTDWDVLTGAIKERFSKAPPDDLWLTPPGSAVRKPPPDTLRFGPGEPPPDPRQLKLLSSGLPAPPPSVWEQFERVE